MASLQEIQGSVLAIYNDLENNKNVLLARAQACKQYTGQIQASIGGTASSEYSQILSLLQFAAETIGKAALAINGAEEKLEKWSQARLGASLRGTGYQAPIDSETETAVDGGGSEPDGGPQKRLTAEEVNERWKSVVQTTDEIVDNYRDALIGLGIPAGKMLEKFLMHERAKMLNYESALLNQASGHGDVRDEDRYTYRTVGAPGEYGFESLTKEYGRFCLDDASKWIKDINPNYYNPFILPRNNPYHVNCGSCAFAVETRLSGGDDLVASANNIRTDYAMEVETGKRCVYMSVADIEDHLRKMGPGSHLIVGINRGPTPNGTPQAGHWFNAFFDGENFHTIDGQSGEILDWPYDYGYVTEWCAMV